jgi:hypothetical protein
MSILNEPKIFSLPLPAGQIKPIPKPKPGLVFDIMIHSNDPLSGMLVVIAKKGANLQMYNFNYNPGETSYLGKVIDGEKFYSVNIHPYLDTVGDDFCSCTPGVPSIDVTFS